MTDPLVRGLLAQIGSPAYLVPCEVTSTSPLLISVMGEDNVEAVKIAGATYSLGDANALWSPPSLPIVLPIG